MCIIVDTNVFARVFDSKNKDHADYKPVKDWILEDNGKLVYGGTKYKTEVIEKKYNRIITLLIEAEKVLKVNDAIVDTHELEVKKLIPDEKFDDKHLAAIVKACGCKLICTSDSRSIDYLRTIKLYGKRSLAPRFYTKKKNVSLLVDSNIAECCKPSKKTTKAQKEKLKGL